MITGLWPENHGIISNSFQDKKIRKRYSLSDRNEVANGIWYHGWPIWCLSEQQNIRSACLFWVGSEAPIQGIRPSYYYQYDGNITYEKRIKQVVDWFKLPQKKRPRFVTLYFEGVDTKGHHYGPKSVEVKKEIYYIDSLLQVLFSSLDSLSLPINKILLSDHGMMEIDTNRIIFTDSVLSKKTNIELYGTHGFIYTKNSKEKDSLYRLLINYHPHMKIFLKEELPDKYHLKNSTRCGDIVLIASPGSHICFIEDSSKIPLADHGYDADEEIQMNGFFIAVGPDIKFHHKIETVDNIDLYPFILKLLDIPIPEKIDGKTSLLQFIN